MGGCCNAVYTYRTKKPSESWQYSTKIQPSIDVVCSFYIGSSVGLFVRLEAYFCLLLCIKHEEKYIIDFGDVFDVLVVTLMLCFKNE